MLHVCVVVLLFIYFHFHRKLIELINAFLKAWVLEYVVLGGGGIPRNTTDLPHPYIYRDSKQGRIVDKRVFYHCVRCVMLHVCVVVTL